jgi:hypothetical protein
MHSARGRPIFALACCLLFAVFAGCGSDGPEIVPVTGMITFEGREQPEVCRLSFLPQETNGIIRPNGGEMTSDGAYELAPFRGVKGLYPGTYSILVSYYDLKPGGNRNVEADWIAHEYETTESLVIEAGARRMTHPITVPAQK